MPQAQLLQDVANLELVTIAIENGKLRMYPGRKGEIVTFYKDPQKSGQDPAKPRQIRWAVTGLGAGQTIRIEPKTAGDGTFSAVYDITHPNNTILSGAPKQGALAGNVGREWLYSVKLLDSSGQQLAMIDPDITVKDDP